VAVPSPELALSPDNDSVWRSESDGGPSIRVGSREALLSGGPDIMPLAPNFEDL
jgi:hypothetical protein